MLHDKNSSNCDVSSSNRILKPTSNDITNLDTIDDVLLPMCGAVQVVRADDVDGGGGGTALHHVHYVVRVRDVETEIMI